MSFDELTWKCHVCHETRSDDKISVVNKPLVIGGVICGEQNVRYCNDNVDCAKKAITFDFIKE